MNTQKPFQAISEHPTHNAHISATSQSDSELGIQFSSFRADIHTGPLPAPHILADYHKIDPKLVERVLDISEMQAKHRWKLENRIVWYNIFLGSGGLFLGFLIALAGFLLTGYLAKIGHPVVSGIVGSLDLGMLVALFVYRQAHPNLPPSTQKQTSNRSLSKR